MSAQLRLHIRTTQKLEGFAGASRVFFEQLRLSERKQIRQIFRLKLDGSPQMFFSRRGILRLKQFENPEQVMGAGEIGHERERFFKLGTNFGGGFAFEWDIMARGAGKEAKLLRCVQIMGQKTYR